MNPYMNHRDIIGAYTHHGSRIEIVELLLQRTGTYNDMFRRPYTASCDQYQLEAIDELIGKKREISPLTIAPIANDILKPAAVYDKQLEIPSGWNEKRVRFVMKVRVTHAEGSQEFEMIQGYTDHFGVGDRYTATNEWTIDETGMTFYINSITRSRMDTIKTINGQMNQFVMTGNEHVLSDHKWDGLYTSEKDTLIRPQDIFSLSSLYSVLDDDALFANLAPTNKSVFSTRANNNASSYLSKVVNAYAQSATEQNFYGEGEAGILTSATGMAAENDVSKDTFIAILNKSRQLPFSNTSFTYADLMRMDPNVVNVTRPLDDASLISNLGQAGSSSFWHGQDRNTQMAVLIAQATPGIMLQSMLSSVAIYSSNETGEILTMVTNYHSYTTSNIQQLIDIFIKKFNLDIANTISMNNGVLYRVKASIDLTGETKISLKLGNDQQFDYVCPSFADAMLTPVVSSNSQNIRGLVGNLQSILDHSFGVQPLNVGAGFEFSEIPPSFSTRNDPHVPVMGGQQTPQVIDVQNSFSQPVVFGADTFNHVIGGRL